MSKNEPAPVLRPCDECGQVDDGPRHVLDAHPERDDRPRPEVISKVIGGGHSPEVTAAAINHLNEGGLYLHLDCCRERGCPDGSCVRQTAGAEELRDDDLRDHLMSLKES